MEVKLGFVQQRSVNRVPIRNCQGVKVGYLASEGGRQVFQSPDGRPVAVILRFKREFVSSRVGASGGSFLPPDYE